jgi:hypothetical protein
MTDMMAFTWQSLSTLLGLSLFLRVVLMPVLKGLGMSGAKQVRIACLISGEAIALIAVGLTKGLSGQNVADALLIGFVAAAAATGLYHALKPEGQARDLGLTPSPPVRK